MCGRGALPFHFRSYAVKAFDQHLLFGQYKICQTQQHTKCTQNCHYKKSPDKYQSFVPRTGIEPAHPCERQILSLLRLPIPPPGHTRFFKIFMCPGLDSNQHTLRRRHLKTVRLPVSPPGQF